MDEEEYYTEHAPGNPFCSADPNCPCHEDPDNIAEVNEAYQNGELTAQEATDFTKGKMF